MTEATAPLDPISTTIRDSATREVLPVRIEFTVDAVLIYVGGYGVSTMQTGYGPIGILEKYEGRLQLLVWPDIEVEDPQVISLERAHEPAIKLTDGV